MKGSTYKRNGAWTAHIEYIDATGTRRQRKKGGFRLQKEAEAEVREMLTAVKNGVAVAPDRLTTGTYLHEWIEHHAAMGSIKPTTAAMYSNKIRLYLVPTFGAVPLQKLSPLDLDRMYRVMIDNGLSAATVRRAHATIHKALHDAERQGLVSYNVARRSNPPTARAAKAPTFTVWGDGELAAFLAHIENQTHGMALRFATLTGARRGEVCGIQWADLDLDGGVATIRHALVELSGGGVLVGTPKSHHERPVALDRDLVARLRRHRAEQNELRLQVGSSWIDRGLVFSTPEGDYLRPDVLSRYFRKYVKAAGLPAIRLHDLRHGHATGLIDAGFDPVTVSSRLGHASVGFTLDVYVKATGDRQAAAAQAFADRIAAAEGG